MKRKSAVAALALAAALLATGFTSPRFPLVPRPSPNAEQQEAVWLMLTVNNYHTYERALITLWDVPPDKWDATGKALSDRDRAFFNAAVVPALGAWHQAHGQCPVLDWTAALLGQR